MKMQLNTLGATVLAGLVLTTNALAQAPGNGGGGGGFGGRGGGGGFASRMAAGAVTSVDANAGTVTITSRMTGQPQTVKVAAATPIATQTTIALTDLKVGDSVQISGVPTAINFTQITAGDLPTGFPGARNGNQNAGQGNANGANAAPPVQAYAMAVGKVKSLTPLTIDLGNGLTLTSNAAAGSKISRISTQTLAGIQVGDQVMSMGQTDADGTFTASAVAVNWPQGGNGGGGGGYGGRGQGGFGGGFGGGGFGGGGFGGGGFGGRGRRGGQGGGQGGQGGGNQGQGGAGANNAPGANVQ